ncbi:methyltransferase domain-containing protein [Eubacteriaceae bacterium ES2]|nr:methyltransferase domain-containing protein [Eubacteriaceae bacterium ES2]
MWNATLYDKMRKERLQPSLDLVGRIAGRQFNRIIDIGCGTGLSTAPLQKNWPDSEIIGVDLSNEMLEKARLQLETVTWLKRDCSQPLDDLGTFDLVFSNAFLQWLKNQEAFLENAHPLLNENGILAVQLPDFQNMAASDCINAVSAKYDSLFAEMDLYHNFPIESYYDILKKTYSHAEVWRTSYYHVLTDHKAILEFIKGTALRPFLARLTPDVENRFLDQILESLRDTYPVHPDGNVLFEFKRMFLLAQK